MTAFHDLRRLGAILLAPALLSATLLAACGGSTSTIDPFQPDRVIVLGDESSVIEADGRKYAMNDDRNAVVAARCLDSPLIIQMVASQYGFVFAQCNPTNIVPKAFIFAQVHARVGDPANGLAQQIAAVPNLGPKDLVTVMIGTNDLIELYERVRAGDITADAAISQSKALGKLAALQISAMLKTGARALVMTVPNVNQSPYATVAGLTDPNAGSLLYQMSYDYNGSLRTNMTPNDGHYWALVLADDATSVIAGNPSTYLTSPTNTTNAACQNPTVLGITRCVVTNDAATTTLVDGANTTNYLWAGDRYLGPVAQARIGQQAQTRATNNPL